MTHIEDELQLLKANLVEMWNLVIVQLTNSREALEKFDKELVPEILAIEKRVDTFELKIDLDCENILACFNPVANDLRFVLAVLKINYNLERIGDYANTIGKIVHESESPFNEEELKESQVLSMFETTEIMLREALDAFVKEDTRESRRIFKQDVKVDKVNKNVNTIIADLISRKPDDIKNYLNLLSVIRKLERVGDQAKNIAEEIIFYIEAKVIRHKKKK